MSDENLDAALARLARQQSSPKKLMQEVQRLFPKASKKQIIRAAFAQMIERAEADLDTSRTLQDFAISERVPAIEPDIFLTTGTRCANDVGQQPS